MTHKENIIKKYLDSKDHKIRNSAHLVNNGNFPHNKPTHCQFCHDNKKLWYMALLIYYDKDGWVIYEESNHVFMGNWDIDKCFLISGKIFFITF